MLQEYTPPKRNWCKLWLAYLILSYLLSHSRNCLPIRHECRQLAWEYTKKREHGEKVKQEKKKTQICNFHLARYESLQNGDLRHTFFRQIPTNFYFLFVQPITCVTCRCGEIYCWDGIYILTKLKTWKNECKHEHRQCMKCNSHTRKYTTQNMQHSICIFKVTDWISAIQLHTQSAVGAHSKFDQEAQ